MNLIVTSAGSSCRRKDRLIAYHRETIVGKLLAGEIHSGKGKNQTINLARPRDT